MKYHNIVKMPNIFLAITGYTKEEFNALLPYFEKELSEDKLLFILTYLKQYTTQLMQPKKKPRGKELTDEDKALNREISKIRIRIEHVMSGIKRYRILKDNFRLKFQPWKKMEFLTTSV